MKWSNGTTVFAVLLGACAPSLFDVAEPSDAGSDEAAVADLLSVDTATLAIDATASPHGDEAQLFAELQKAQAQVPAPGGAMAVRRADGTFWSGAVGDIDIVLATKTSPDSRFRIWSISKTMTAAIALQLVDEGKLALDDPLSRWFPQFPKSAQIKLRQLLSHTSGIPDYFTDPAVVAAWADFWTPAQMIAVAARLPRLSEPGVAWNYSNTNYVLLGRVIEMTTGNSLSHELHTRLFSPLGLHNTFIWGEDQVAPARGYETNGQGGFVDVLEKVHPSVVWATGQIVSTAEDLRAWCSALIEGKVLSDSMRQAMVQPAPLSSGATVNWGLGVAITPTQWGPLIGHGGGPLHGNSGTMAYLPSKKLLVVTLVNGSSDNALSVVGAAGWKTLIEEQ